MAGRVKIILFLLINLPMLIIKKVMYKKGLVINGKVLIRGRGKISIGENVVINSSLSSNYVSGSSKTVLCALTNESEIIIGNGVGISCAVIIAFNKITIEENSYIGSGVKIWDTDFHSLEYDLRINGDTNIKSSPIYIKKGAFIGANSIVLKGITIGEKSIVGAGSVITRDIPDGEIWAGNPARFIKKVEI